MMNVYVMGCGEDVIDDMSKKQYIGMTAGPFKLRYNNHKKSFRDPEHAKDTAIKLHLETKK